MIKAPIFKTFLDVDEVEHGTFPSTNI